MKTSLEKSPLISIYRTLDKKEQRELGKWLASPTHNQREDVRQLHDYLLNGDRLAKPKALEKERVWRRLYPKERFDDAKMRQVLHFSLKSVENWLSYRQWRKDEVNTRIALAKELRRRRLDRHLMRTLRQLEKQQSNTAHRTEAFFRNEYLIQQEYYTYRATRERTSKDLNLQPVSNALDRGYLIEKLKSGCWMLFHQRLSKTPYDTGLLEPVINNIREEELVNNPTLAIYYYVLQAIQQEDDGGYFEKLRNTVRQHENLLPLVDLREVYLMAINLCIPKFNKGSKAYGREVFEWYRQGFDRGILLENNKMTRYTYINVAFTAINLGELDWTENFLNTHRDYIEEAFREQAFGLAMIRLYYTRKDYGKSMRLLAQSDFEDPVYNLLSKYILLKIYYELNEFDALESLLDSLGAYLRRKDIVEIQKVNGKNIIRMMRALLRLEPYDKVKRQELRQEIENTQPLTERKWFLEQLDG